MLRFPEEPGMTRLVLRRTIAIIAILVIAAGQMVAWPSLQACMAIAGDGRVCHVEGSECCGHGGDATASVERTNGGTQRDHPLGNDCDCRQCFCKICPSTAFLTAANGCAFSLPDSFFSNDAYLDLPAFDFSRSFFHPPRA